MWIETLELAYTRISSEPFGDLPVSPSSTILTVTFPDMHLQTIGDASTGASQRDRDTVPIPGVPSTLVSPSSSEKPIDDDCHG